MRTVSLLIILFVAISSCSFLKSKSDSALNKYSYKEVEIELGSAKNIEAGKLGQVEVELKEVVRSSEEIRKYDYLTQAIINISYENEKRMELQPEIFLKDSLLYITPDSSADSRIIALVEEKFLIAAIESTKPDSFSVHEIRENESFFYKNYKITLDGINKNPEHNELDPDIDQVVAGALLRIEELNGSEIMSVNRAEPIFIIRENKIHYLEDILTNEKLVVRFTNVIPSTEKFQIQIGAFKMKPKFPITFGFINE